MSDPAASTVRVLPHSQGYDRVPPHDLDAETSVIGAMLLSKDAIAEVSELVGPEDFYRGAHRTMFEAIHELYDRGEPVDAVTLADELKRRGRLDDVGGTMGVADVVNRVPTAANALYYAKIVAAHALRRRLIEAGTEITKLGYTDAEDVQHAVDTAESLVYRLSQYGRVSEFTPMKQLIAQGFELIERLHENNSAITGLATGFTDLDELTAGLQPSNLVILAARPSMGKCLAGSTEVLDSVTGEVTPIAELVRRGQRGERVGVITLGQDFAFDHGRDASAVHDNGVQPVFRVRTRLGHEVVATANHPLLTLDGWLPVAMLRPGWKIATARSLPFFGHDLMSEHEVALLAYLIGDGGISAGTPSFTTTSRRLLADLRTCLRPFGAVARRTKPDRLDHHLVGPEEEPNPITACLRRHGLYGTKSATKFVPAAVFRLPREQVATFLNRLFACDGSVYVNDAYAQVTYTTISERLARQVQHLLRRFGVIAKLRELKRPVYEGTGKRAWELQVTAPDSVRRLAREIGILGKEAKLEAALRLFERKGGSPNRDLVPVEVWERVIAVKEQRRWRELSDATLRPPSHNWHVGTRAPSRALLTEIAEHCEDPMLLGPVYSDVYWDEIVSIEPAGEERVYDLTVPGTHNFVANDVVVHNSTLAVNIGTNIAVEQRKPVVLFSLEMSQMELVQRILAAEARVDSERLRTGRLREPDWPKLSRAMGKLAEAPFFIDDTPGITLMEIRSKARRLKQQHGLDLLIVDYLQLMQAHRRHESRVQEVSELSRGLKILAKELDIPVLALSQLSRRPEDRTDRRPQLADLRESGSIEQDADLVCFIYRDEVYNPDSDAKGEAELIVAKHRNGPLKTVPLAFLGATARFASLRRSAPSAGVPPGPGGAPVPPPDPTTPL